MAGLSAPGRRSRPTRHGRPCPHPGAPLVPAPPPHAADARAARRAKLASARRPRGKALMGGRVGAARSLAHVTPVRALLTTAAPGDAGALRSPGAPPGNVSISCRLLPAGARAPSGRAEPSRAAGSGPAPQQVGEVPAPAPAPGLRDPSPIPGRRRLRAAAEGRGRRRLRRLPGASRAARCSPRPRRPSGAGGRVPSAGREWDRPHKLCEDRSCAGGHKVCCLPVGSREAAAFAASWGKRDAGVARGLAPGNKASVQSPRPRAFRVRAAPCERALGSRREIRREPARMEGVSGRRIQGVRLQLAPLASQGTPEDGLRRSDLPPSGFASAAPPTCRTPLSPPPRPGVHEQWTGTDTPGALPYASERKAPAWCCALPPPPSAWGQLRWAGEIPLAALGAPDGGGPRGRLWELAGSARALLVARAKPLTEQGKVEARPLAPEAPPRFRWSLGKRRPLGL